jgi:Legionella pneumophila major outer membrane protein precursor
LAIVLIIRARKRRQLHEMAVRRANQQRSDESMTVKPGRIGSDGMPARHWSMLAMAALFLVMPATMVRADPPLNPWDEDPEAISAVPDDEFVAGDEEIDEPATEVALAVGLPSLTSRFQCHAGLLFLQPSADNLGWAVLTTEKNFASPVPLATPYWEIESLTPGYQPGFEVGGGYALASPGKDLQVNWQHLRTSTSDAAAVTQADGQWISPFSQTGPPTADTYDELYSNSGVNKLLSADGQVKFAYDAVNVDFGQYLDLGWSLSVRLFAGLSYARLQERLYSSFFGAPPAPDAVFPESVPLSISLNNTTSFWGVGPRFGLDTAYQTPGGFRFTAQLAGALLIGQTQPAQYEFTATAPELAAIGIPVNREFISSQSFSHVVYATNAKLGIGYSRVLPSGARLTVDGGYLAAIYLSPFSGYETNENILALQIGSLSTGSMKHIPLSDFSLNGFYLNAGLTW